MLQELPKARMDRQYTSSLVSARLTHTQDVDGNHKLPATEVAAIKQEIVGLMISVPPNIQSQLGDAVGIIADSDFWRDWDTLVDVCSSRCLPAAC